MIGAGFGESRRRSGVCRELLVLFEAAGVKARVGDAGQIGACGARGPDDLLTVQLYERLVNA